jgi:hypothetical protein
MRSKKLLLSLVTFMSLVGSIALTFGALQVSLAQKRSSQPSIGMVSSDFPLPGGSDLWGTAFDKKSNSIGIFNPSKNTFSQYPVPTWPTGNSEPNNWMVTAQDTAFLAGYCGLRLQMQGTVTATITQFTALVEYSD